MDQGTRIKMAAIVHTEITLAGPYNIATRTPHIMHRIIELINKLEVSIPETQETWSLSVTDKS